MSLNINKERKRDAIPQYIVQPVRPFKARREYDLPIDCRPRRYQVRIGNTRVGVDGQEQRHVDVVVDPIRYF